MIEGETMKDENRKIARLIKQIQRGNQSAFEEFYKLTSPKAYFIALKITQNEHDAEDILQESYIKVLEKINEIDTSQNVTSWFLKIVSNKSKDLLKSKSRIVFENEEETVFDEIPEDKTEFCPEENLNQEELRFEVMAAIDELTAEKRACIMMMYFGDMSVKEIAESIEVPESTVKNRLFTARKDLKNKFEKKDITSLYSAAPLGVVVWAIEKSSETVAATFAASSASAAVMTEVSASTAASGASAAATGTGIAAKAAALTVTQKVVAGVAAASIIGGSAAGVATVVKNSIPSPETTTYVEEVTTAPSQTTEFAFAEITTKGTTEETAEKSTAQKSKTTLASTSKREPTATTAALTEEKETEKASAAATTPKRTRKTTTRRDYSLYTSTATQTTTQISTTEETTTEKNETETTTEMTTETTTRYEATQTTVQSTTETTTETTTESTMVSLATVNVEIIDINGDVADTLTLTVPAETEMTWEYLVALIKENGYEPKAGIYGDAVDAVAQAEKTYTITAEL